MLLKLLNVSKRTLDCKTLLLKKDVHATLKNKTPRESLFRFSHLLSTRRFKNPLTSLLHFKTVYVYFLLHYKTLYILSYIRLVPNFIELINLWLRWNIVKHIRYLCRINSDLVQESCEPSTPTLVHFRRHPLNAHTATVQDTIALILSWRF